MPEHMMIFGRGADFPARVRTTNPEFETTLVCRLNHLRRLDEPKGNIRILALRQDAPLDECVALALSIHAVHPVTHIAAFGEHDHDRAAAVALALGLPGHDVETVRMVQNKLAMRTRLRESGVEDTAAALVADIHELAAFADRHGYPFIVKPVSSTASYGVSKVLSPQDLAPALEHATRPFEGVNPQGVLAEQFHVGPQFSVEGFAEDGEHEVVAITCKYSDAEHFVELGHLVPAPLKQDVQEAIHKHVNAAVEALRIRFGPTHTEITLTADGPRIIETHLRAGGDEIPDLVRGAIGIDMLDLQVRQSLGERVLPTLRRIQAASRRPRFESIWFASTAAKGTLLEIRQSDTSDNCPITLQAKPGQRLEGLQDSFSRLAFARAGAESPKQALDLAQSAIHGLEVVIAADCLAPRLA